MATYGGKDRSSGPGGQGSDVAGGRAGAGPADSHDSGGGYSVGKDRYGSAGTIAATRAAASKALPPLNAPQKPFPGSIQGYAPVSELQAQTRGAYNAAIKDKKNVGNTTGEDIGNFIADHLAGVSELDPAYQGMGHFSPDPSGVPHPGQADWGFDAIGAGVGFAGGLAGVPGIGQAYDASRRLLDAGGILNKDWGKVNLGPDVLGGIGDSIGRGTVGAGGANTGGIGVGANTRGSIGGGGAGGQRGQGGEGGGRLPGGGGNTGGLNTGGGGTGGTGGNKDKPPPPPPAPTYNWQGELASAMPQLRSDFDYQLKQRGLGPKTTDAAGNVINWDDVFNSEIQHRIAGIPVGTTGGTDKSALDQAINQYLLPNVGSTALDDYQTLQRSTARNALGGQALDADINTKFGSSVIQPYLDSIYNDQYKAARQQVENTKMRGEFNDQGYNAALGLLDTQGTAGKATLSDLGNSYLTTDKKTLGDALSGIYDKIGNYQLGSGYTPSSDVNAFKTQEGTLGGQLQGQITGAAPSIFDTSTLFQKASAQQGATSTGSLSDTLAQRNLDQTKGRGLGSQGAF